MIASPALEIGPFDEPFLLNAEYFDILDQEALKQRAVVEGRNPDGCPFIHYTGSLKAIDKRFRSVFSSHTIEHTPDLIEHLEEEVAALLEPDGAYYLIVPDKRFCFDHYLPESTLSSVQSGRGRSRPSKEAIFEHRVETTHNILPFDWLGIHGKRNNDVVAADRDASLWQSGEYIDVHQWQFTPQSFLTIMRQLQIFESVTVFDTAFGSLEFMAILASPAQAGVRSCA
jgi:hypothetical protein